MKKFIIIACIAVAFGGCKKETEIEKFNETIQGTWSLQSNKIEYYDAGTKEYEEVLSGAGTFQEVTFLNNLTARFVVHDGTLLSTGYDISDIEGKRYVEFFNIAVFEAQGFEVSSSSSSNMKWVKNYINIQFENKETGEIKIASKAVLTLQLIKK